MATYKQLLAQTVALEAQLAEMCALQIAGVIERIRALMDEYGLSVDDIGVKRRRGRLVSGRAPELAKEPLPPYRDPKTGDTWSGRGRAPAWLGKNPNRFIISED